MNEEQSLKEFQEVMQRVVEAETDDFFELAEILGRDPKTDLVGANLSEVNFQGGNLQGANLRYTDLSRADLSNVNLIGADLGRANLRGANLSSADLSNANLRDADLTNANLTGTKLSNAKVENTRFRNNRGIDEIRRRELKAKKAVIEDFQEVRNMVKVEKHSISGFFKYTFLGQKDYQLIPVVDIAELSDVRVVDLAELSDVRDVSEQNIQSKSTDRESFLTKIIIPINWLLLTVGSVSFCIIVYNSVYLKNAIASEIIYHSFSLILGWFGGVLTSYLR